MRGLDDFVREAGLIELLAPVGVSILWLAAAYLMLLGIIILIRPSLARNFLSGFAQTTKANLTEAAVRALVGAGFIMASPATKMPLISLIIGLFLASSAVLLILVPGLHRKFAQRSTRAVFNFFPLLGGSSIILGGALAWFIA